MKNIIFIVITLVLFQVPLFSNDIIWNKKFCSMPWAPLEEAWNGQKFNIDYSNDCNFIYCYQNNWPEEKNSYIYIMKSDNLEIVNCLKYKQDYFGDLIGVYKDASDSVNNQLYLFFDNYYDSLKIILIDLPNGNIIKQFTYPHIDNFKILNFNPKKKLLLYKIEKEDLPGDYNHFYLKNIETGELVLNDTIPYQLVIPKNVSLELNGMFSKNGKFMVVSYFDYDIFRIYDLDNMKLLYESKEHLLTNKYFLYYHIYNDGIYSLITSDKNNIIIINPFHQTYEIKNSSYKNNYYNKCFYDKKENMYSWLNKDTVFILRKDDSLFSKKIILSESRTITDFDSKGNPNNKSNEEAQFVAFHSSYTTLLIASDFRAFVQNINSNFEIKKSQHIFWDINKIEFALDNKSFSISNPAFFASSNINECVFPKQYYFYNGAVNYQSSTSQIAVFSSYNSDRITFYHFINMYKLFDKIIGDDDFYCYISFPGRNNLILVDWYPFIDDKERELIIFNSENGTEIFRKNMFNIYKYKKYKNYYYTLSNDNRYLFITSDSSAQCFNIHDGSEIELPHINISNKLEFNSDMTKMLFVDFTNKRLCSVKFNISENSLIADSKDIINFKHNNFIESFEGEGTYTFSPSGKEVITAGPRIYNAETGELIKAFDNDEYFANVFAVSPNSEFIIGKGKSLDCCEYCQNLIMWNVKDYLTSVEDNPAQEQALLSLQIIPNPAASQATVSLELQEPADFTIEFRDILGNTVLKENQSALSSGKQSISLDLSSLPTGMYNCILRTGARIEQVKILIVK